jgi:hypothetical protein
MKTVFKYPIKNSSETVLVELETEGGQMVKASRARESAKPATGICETHSNDADVGKGT